MLKFLAYFTCQGHHITLDKEWTRGEKNKIPMWGKAQNSKGPPAISYENHRLQILSFLKGLL